MREGTPRKILVLQTWGIGDMIMTTPMLSSIRKAFAGAHVTVVAGSAASAEAVDPSLYDNMHVLPEGWRHPVVAVRAFRALRSGHFDISLTATRLPPWFGPLLRWISGIQVVVGDHAPGSWSLHTHQVVSDPEEHRVLGNHRILKQIAPCAETGVLGVAVGAEAAARAGTLWRAAGLEGACVLAVQPGSDPKEGMDKRPNLAVLRRVIGGFVEGSGERGAAIFFGPKEASLVSEYADLGPRVKLFHDLELSTVFALLDKCAVLVGGDASLGHAAAARGIPTLTLAGPTMISSTRPWGPLAEIIQTQQRLECMPCYGTALYGSCPYDARCMSQIDPADVLARINRLLERAREDSPAS